MNGHVVGDDWVATKHLHRINCTRQESSRHSEGDALFRPVYVLLPYSLASWTIHSVGAG